MIQAEATYGWQSQSLRTGQLITTQRNVWLYGAETWLPPSEPKSASPRMNQILNKKKKNFFLKMNESD